MSNCVSDTVGDDMAVLWLQYKSFIIVDAKPAAGGRHQAGHYTNTKDTS